MKNMGIFTLRFDRICRDKIYVMKNAISLSFQIRLVYRYLRSYRRFQFPELQLQEERRQTQRKRRKVKMYFIAQNSFHFFCFFLFC
jgi:hypothetical protein